MDWQKIAGDLLNQVTNKKDEEGEAAKTGEGGGLLGLAQTALAALQGQGDKGQLLGQLVSKASGSNLQELLQQLGINPQVADDPDSATEEDLQKIADHLGQNAEQETASDDTETAEATNESEAQDTSEAESSDDSTAADDSPVEASDDQTEDSTDEESEKEGK